MTSGAGPLQYTPHSKNLICVPLDCVTCPVGLPVSHNQSCGSYQVVLRSFSNMLHCALVVPPGQPQTPAPETSVAETPLLEVCPAKTSPHDLVFPSTLLLGLGAPSQRVRIPTWMSNAVSLPSGDQRVARISSSLPESHISDSGTLLMFADLVLFASPCSVTTTVSDDASSMPTNSWVEPRLPLSSSRHVQDLFSNSRIGVFSFPQYLCIGQDSDPFAMLQCSLQCPGLTGNEPHRTLDDPVRMTFSHWRSL